jgi:hypothetical protein
MLLPARKVLYEHYALVLQMNQDVGSNTQVAHNLELFCDLELMMGLSCIMPMLEGLNDSIKFS